MIAGPRQFVDPYDGFAGECWCSVDRHCSTNVNFTAIFDLTIVRYPLAKFVKIFGSCLFRNTPKRSLSDPAAVRDERHVIRIPLVILFSHDHVTSSGSWICVSKPSLIENFHHFPVRKIPTRRRHRFQSLLWDSIGRIDRCRNGLRIDIESLEHRALIRFVTWRR